MKYFENIPSIKYPYYGKMIGDDDMKVTMVDTVDIMLRFRIRGVVSNNPLSSYNYEWQTGDRPDTVAALYYGSSDFAWLVMMSASAFDWLYDFPMPQRQFQDYIASKYGSFMSSISTVHHYEDGDGHVIDVQSYIESEDPKKRSVNCFQFEEEVNESKRNVKLISNEYIGAISAEYTKLLKSIKESRDLLKTQQIMVI